MRHLYYFYMLDKSGYDGQDIGWHELDENGYIQQHCFKENALKSRARRIYILMCRVVGIPLSPFRPSGLRLAYTNAIETPLGIISIPDAGVEEPKWLLTSA